MSKNNIIEEGIKEDMELILIEDLGMMFAKEDSKHKARYGLYKCGFCGKEFKAMICNVNKEHTTSCGCQRRGNIKHGLCKNKFYNTWHNMMARCNNAKNKHYENYGGRGITVCEEWLDIVTFLNWCEETYIENMSLDREDNDRGYSPENCRGVDRTTQSINQRMQNNNTSGYTGVYFHKRDFKWYATIKIAKKSTHIGSYDTPLEAAQARDLYVIENNLPYKLNLPI